MKQKIYKRLNKKLPKYQGIISEFEFMKYWPVIKRWAIVNYDLKSGVELEVLLVLYSKKLFTRTELKEQLNYMSWDAGMLKRLEEKGMIQVWIKRSWGESNIYNLTHKSKKMISGIYKKMLGLEPIPESPRRNRVFRENAPFHQKTLAKAITKVNEERKRRPFLE
jgi:DNA-binding MarR family transcriptional regulator